MSLKGPFESFLARVGDAACRRYRVGPANPIDAQLVHGNRSGGRSRQPRARGSAVPGFSARRHASRGQAPR